MKVVFDPQRRPAAACSPLPSAAHHDANKVTGLLSTTSWRGGDGYSSFAAIDPRAARRHAAVVGRVMIHLRGRDSVQGGSKAASPPDSETPPHIAARRRPVQKVEVRSAAPRNSRPATPAPTLRPVCSSAQRLQRDGVAGPRSVRWRRRQRRPWRSTSVVAGQITARIALLGAHTAQTTRSAGSSRDRRLAPQARYGSSAAPFAGLNT
jgi:hypothetical protein